MEEDSWCHCVNTSHTLSARIERGKGVVNLTWQCSECDANGVDVMRDDVLIEDA